jgi:alkylation response protein AidB-like acyl-CoA dehydrogenase
MMQEARRSYRESVVDRLRDPELQKTLAGLSGPEPDARPLYRQLGELGLLAPNWPEEYGGAGLGQAEAAIGYEELVRAGIPDTLHVNTIQIVGLFLLLAGTPEQRAAHLPALARGERFASVLYTEPQSGSDLGSLRTTARPDGDGWILRGEKVYSLKSDVTDLGLCAARVGGGDRYEGITLFLVDLHAPGVRRSPIPSIADEQFHRVVLDDVRVGADAVLGEVGGGWPLLTQALAIERTGLDYTLKAEKWFAAAGLDGVDAARYEARIAASRLLSWSVLERLDRTGGADETSTAVAKYYSSELAQDVAGWAVRAGAGGDGLLEAAYREAPGLTFSAGASEVMLQIIADLGLDEPEAETGDPLQERLRRKVRSRIADVPDGEVWAAVCRTGALTIDAPLAAGGMELGVAAAAAVAEELGRRAADTPYVGVTAAVDARGEPVAEDADVVLGPETVTVDGDLLRLERPARDRARLRQSALLLGLASGALEQAVRHTAARTQFGRRLRDFQSVAFRLAHAYAEVAAVRALVRHATWLADAGLDHTRATAQALALAAETALAVTRLAMQVHGARGLTPEAAVAGHYLRARAEATRLGSPLALWRELS